MTLKELTDKIDNTLTSIKTRLYFLQAFEKKLVEVTRNKPFTIKNDIVYRQIFDMWDMLVIDFSSLAKGMLGNGGFFNQFKADLHEFKPLKKKDITSPRGNIHSIDPMPPERMEEIQVELSNYFIDSIYKARKDLLYELFPKLKNRPSGKIKHEDVDDLKVRFETIVKGIIDDRDNNRAHRFESLKSRSVTPRLGFKELGEKFEKVEKILNAIKIVSTGENFAYNDLNFASKDETSWDLIFSILWNGKKTLDMVSGVNKQLNSCPSETKVYGWMLLKKLLEDSHRKHDELQEEIRMNPTAQGIEEKKKLCFNDMKMEENWR